ncbi:MAG: GNAT family N-acetyltransferase [Marinosulfonomonas sp.]
MRLDAFQTERLNVQNWTSQLNDPAQHAALVTALTAILTPTVLQHLPEPLHLPKGATAVSDWITDRAAESDVMTLVDKTDGAVLGVLILAIFPDAEGSSSMHLGYLLGEQAWGKGYASELIKGLILCLQHQKEPIELLGGVERANPASARVLVKNGFVIAPELATETSDMFRRLIAP